MTATFGRYKWLTRPAMRRRFNRKVTAITTGGGWPGKRHVRMWKLYDQAARQGTNR